MIANRSHCHLGGPERAGSFATVSDDPRLPIGGRQQLVPMAPLAEAADSRRPPFVIGMNGFRRAEALAARRASSRVVEKILGKNGSSSFERSWVSA